MSAADPWQQTGRSGNRSSPSGRMPRVDRDAPGERGPRRRPDVPPPSRNRPSDRRDLARAERRPSYGDSGEFAAASAPRWADEPGRPGRRPERDDVRRPAAPRGATAQSAGRRTTGAETGGSRLRGILAVLGVFLVTLAAAGVESFIGTGLGMFTLVALVGSSAAATLLVRRRDVFSVMVVPPLIYVAVALIDIALAPSATFSLATAATLLIKGFPAMAIATVVSLVIGLIRLAARR